MGKMQCTLDLAAQVYIQMVLDRSVNVSRSRNGLQRATSTLREIDDPPGKAI